MGRATSFDDLEDLADRLKSCLALDLQAGLVGGGGALDPRSRPVKSPVTCRFERRARDPRAGRDLLSVRLFRVLPRMAVTPSDPITLEIIQSSLQAISNEMFSSMRKTAMSSIIYEVLDMGTCITDADGELAASGAGIPAFVATLDKAVKRIIALNGGAGEIAPGDVFVTNDPYYGGVTHLNDVVFALPVFAGGELVAWTANIAHWNDVGGMVPGSISNRGAAALPGRAAAAGRSRSSRAASRSGR